jgi:hypothetical protein
VHARRSMRGTPRAPGALSPNCHAPTPRPYAHRSPHLRTLRRQGGRTKQTPGNRFELASWRVGAEQSEAVGTLRSGLYRLGVTRVSWTATDDASHGPSRQRTSFARAHGRRTRDMTHKPTIVNRQSWDVHRQISGFRVVLGASGSTSRSRRPTRSRPSAFASWIVRSGSSPGSTFAAFKQRVVASARVECSRRAHDRRRIPRVGARAEGAA